MKSDTPKPFGQASPTESLARTPGAINKCQYSVLMTDILQNPWQKETIIRHSQRLLHSYQHWTGESLFDLNASPGDIALKLFEAPFVVISHGIEADPIFNYANRKALELGELSWNDFIHMPSRNSAEGALQDDRQHLLAGAATKGFIRNFSGIRISSTGKRFSLKNTALWNVFDENKQRCGQAAFFSNWEYL
jgi:hypothetical protein